MLIEYHPIQKNLKKSFIAGARGRNGAARSGNSFLV